MTTDPILDLRSLGDLAPDERDRPIGAGTAAARPAANMVKANSFYYSTDTNSLSFSNGVAWTAITAPGGTQSLGTTLPGSPVDGQLHTLVDSTSNPTYAWQLRYNPAEATYKWECIGGTWKVVTVETRQTMTSAGSWMDLTTDGPSFTTPYAGDWDAIALATAHGPSGGGGQIHSIGVTTAGGTPGEPSDAFVSGPGGQLTVVTMATLTGISASSVIKMRYKAQTTTDSDMSARRMRLMPRRLI